MDAFNPGLYKYLWGRKGKMGSGVSQASTLGLLEFQGHFYDMRSRGLHIILRHFINFQDKTDLAHETVKPKLSP